MSFQPPEGKTENVDVGELNLSDLVRRAKRDDLAPTTEAALLRYLIYLGAAYLEAEAIASASSVEVAYEQLHRLFGAAGGHGSILRFHYSEQARTFAEEERAHAAHERAAGAYEYLIEKMEREIETREERVANLEAAFG